MIISEENKFKNLFLTTAIFMVYFTTFLQGGTIKWIVGFLGIEKAKKQEKNISEDVHGKTMDNLMGGIESVIGGVHRHVVLEVFSIYDEKYIQKWFLHDEAVNLLALKAETLSITEHYTRLYGPRISVESTHEPSDIKSARSRVLTFNPKTEERTILDINPQSTDQELLKTAFDSHPYSVYTNKVDQPNYRHPDSHDALTDVIKHQQKRTTQLWNTAFSEVKRKSLQQSVTTKETQNLDEKDEDVATILEVYKDVKRKSKSFDEPKVV